MPSKSGILYKQRAAVIDNRSFSKYLEALRNHTK